MFNIEKENQKIKMYALAVGFFFLATLGVLTPLLADPEAVPMGEEEVAPPSVPVSETTPPQAPGTQDVVKTGIELWAAAETLTAAEGPQPEDESSPPEKPVTTHKFTVDGKTPITTTITTSTDLSLNNGYTSRPR